jgi:heme-degrading monooxygenase HmoA
MVRVTLHMKVKPGKEQEFERAWHAVSERARHVPGNLRQTLMRDPDEEASFVITTEWESRETYHGFEVSAEQDELTAPLRALRESARQTVYDIVADVASDANGGGPATAAEEKGRVVFAIRLKPGMQERFLAAYESMRYEVARGVPGHIVDQVCSAPDDPDSWLITSEWESLDDFLAWERTEEHRALARPLRECMAEARSLKYVVRAETSGGSTVGVGAGADGQGG